MKKLINIFVSAAFLAVFTACTSEVDDVFDKSSSERITEAIKADTEVLTSAPNGWIMYYYGDLQYGGYNVLCKFNTDNTVTVASEKFFKSNQTATSHFKIEQSAGVVLSFDEYNEIFHWFSNPVNPIGWGTDGTGFGGDLEFRIVTATKDKVELTGKKTQNKIVMLPMPAGTSWEDYLNQIADIENDMTAANLITIDDKGTEKDTIQTSLSYRRLSFVVDKNGTATTVRAPYVVTPEGFQFYDSLAIGDKNLTGFKYVKNSIVYEDFTESSVTLKCIVPPLTEQLINGAWYLSVNGMSAENAALWKAFNAGTLAHKSIGRAVTYAYIGSYTSDDGTTFGVVYAPYYIGQQILSYETEGEDILKDVKVNGTRFNGSWFATNVPSIIPAVSMFGEYTVGDVTYGKATSYKLETDNIKNPSYIKMTDLSNPTNTFTLSPTRVSYPFN